MSSKPITLYTVPLSPFAKRVEMALEEVKADYVKYNVNLQNKPEWFTSQVNPAGQVPALAYGGPKVPPDQPSPDSTKLAESLVLLEFIADLFPHSTLLPKDPVGRAKARFFIDKFANKLQPRLSAVVRKGEMGELLASVEELQALLPDDDDDEGGRGRGRGRYVLGEELSIADVAVAPFLGMLYVALETDKGAFAEGEGTKYHQILETDPKYAKFKRYVREIRNRESFKATFEPKVVELHLANRFSRK